MYALNHVRTLLIAVVAHGWTAGVHAQVNDYESPPAEVENKPEAKAPPSLLKQPYVEPIVPDLRGHAGKELDALLQTHFTRLAQLDVMEEIATKANSSTLLEEIEQTRRSALELFRTGMLTVRKRLAADNVSPTAKRESVRPTALPEAVDSGSKTGRGAKAAGRLDTKASHAIYRAAYDVARSEITKDNVRTRLFDLRSGLTTP